MSLRSRGLDMTLLTFAPGDVDCDTTMHVTDAAQVPPWLVATKSMHALGTEEHLQMLMPSSDDACTMMAETHAQMARVYINDVLQQWRHACEKWGLNAMLHDEVERQLGGVENITMAEAVPQPPCNVATCDAALEWRDRGRHAAAWGTRGGDGSPVCPCMLNAGMCTREGNVHPLADTERGTLMAQAAISDMPNGAEDITCSCRRSFSTQLAMRLQQANAPRDETHVMMPDGMHMMAGGGSMRNEGSSEIVASGMILLPNLGTRSVSSTCEESNALQPFLERAVKQHMQENNSLTAHVDNVATVQGELARINEQSHRRERNSATGKAGAKMHASMQTVRRAGGSANVTHAPA